jgi:hypothetical protein
MTSSDEGGAVRAPRETGGAVGRGRVRRITPARGLGAAAVLGTVAAAVFTLLHTVPGGAPAVRVASVSTVRTTGVRTTSGPTTGVRTAGVSASPSPGTAWMPGYLTRTFASLAPGTSAALRAYAPRTTLTGDSSATVRAELTTARGKSAAELVVEGHTVRARCPAAPGPYDDCAATAARGGTLVTDRSFKDPVRGTGVSIWTVRWNGPDGQTVALTETAADAAHQALTTRQAAALVTAPEWERAWRSLPARCRFGTMVKPHATGRQSLDGEALTCATSRSVALRAPSGG